MLVNPRPSNVVNRLGSTHEPMNVVTANLKIGLSGGHKFVNLVSTDFVFGLSGTHEFMDTSSIESLVIVVNHRLRSVVSHEGGCNLRA